MEKTVKIAGVQFEAFSDAALSVSKASELITMSAKRGAKMVCLPQLFANRWFPASIDKSAFSIAEEEGGFIISTLRELAKDEGIVIVAPIFERVGEEDGGSDAEFFNTVFVIGTKGEIIGKYRKLHIPQIPLWEEKSYFKKGDLGLPVFDTPFGKVGVLLCRDVFYPDAFRVLAEAGAEIVFTPTAAAYYHSRFKWERAIQASAHINGLFIFRVNRVGKEEKQNFYGRSFCTRPDGEFLVRPTGSSEGIVLAEVDLNEINTVKNEWAFIKDRSPDDYINKK